MTELALRLLETVTDRSWEADNAARLEQLRQEVER